MSDGFASPLDYEPSTGLLCPNCARHTVVLLRLVDDAGRHQHTRYCCTSWRDGWCGWQGWVVPEP